MLTRFLCASEALAGVKTYKKYRKKREFSKFLQSESQVQGYKPERKLPILGRVKAVFTFGNTRNQQLEAISSDEDKRRRLVAEKQINRALTIAGTSLGLTTVGLFYWPLGLVGALLFLYASIPVHKKTFQLLKQGKVGVDALITITLAGCVSLGYFWIGSFATVVQIAGRKLLLRVTEDSRNKLIDVFRQYPKSAWVVVDGVEVEVPLEEVNAGQTVVVNAGETIPVDGTIIEGMAAVDQHILTGESKPAEKEPGDEVFALTVVLSGRISVKVEKAGNETTVAQIGQVLNDTIEFKATAQLRAETLSDKTALPTLIAGCVSLPFLGPIGALAVINSHFKHKMSVIAPIGLMNFLNLASQKGILVKDGRSLELLNQVDTMVFDKTGTLTEEKPYIGAIHACVDYEDNKVLMYAAAAEQKQTHPIAKAILEEAHQRRLSIPEIDEAEYKIGYGLTVKISSSEVRVGSRRFMEICGISIPPELHRKEESCHGQGHSLIMVAIDSEAVGAIELLPTIRPEAKQVIRELRERHGIQSTYIISGDHETPTKTLAAELGVDHYFAETLPEEKANIVEQLQNEGKFICYVGDGINDSIALKKSQVSISLRGASTIAVDTAQIILMDERMSNLISLFDYAQDFHSNVNTTFGIVVIPTLIGIGGVLFLHFGLVHTIMLNLMSLAAGTSNSMLPLLKYKLTSEKVESKADLQPVPPKQRLTGKPVDIPMPNVASAAVTT
jgi:heavy metal translocating P-type ATPase